MWYNPMMIWLLRSPFHGMISKGTMLVSVTGRKSGRTISTPTNYLRDGNTLCVISWRNRKWWRNLRGGAPVRVLLAGKGVEGCGQVIEEQKAVARSLFDYYQKAPKLAKYVGIGLDAAGFPVPADCERAAQRLVVVRLIYSVPSGVGILHPSVGRCKNSSGTQQHLLLRGDSISIRCRRSHHFCHSDCGGLLKSGCMAMIQLYITA